jgi:hypothetical protein
VVFVLLHRILQFYRLTTNLQPFTAFTVTVVITVKGWIEYDCFSLTKNKHVSTLLSGVYSQSRYPKKAGLILFSSFV